jgi:hypothetical protein
LNNNTATRMATTINSPSKIFLIIERSLSKISKMFHAKAQRRQAPMNDTSNLLNVKLKLIFGKLSTPSAVPLFILPPPFAEKI